MPSTTSRFNANFFWSKQRRRRRCFSQTTHQNICAQSPRQLLALYGPLARLQHQNCTRLPPPPPPTTATHFIQRSRNLATSRRISSRSGQRLEQRGTRLCLLLLLHHHLLSTVSRVRQRSLRARSSRRKRALCQCHNSFACYRLRLLFDGKNICHELAARPADESGRHQSANPCRHTDRICHLDGG